MSQYTREEVIEKVKRGESLEGADLSRIDLSKVNFSAYPKDCKNPVNFRSCNFFKANLNNSNFSFGIFTEANLEESCLENTFLSGTNFQRAKLHGANLIRIFAPIADFNGADFSGATLSRVCRLEETDLRGTNFDRANIHYVDFCGANLEGVDLSKTKISNIMFRNTILRKTNLSGVDLTGAYFEEADLSEAVLIKTKLNEARFIRVNLQKTNLSEANLSKAKFIQIHLDGTILTNANFSEAKIDFTSFKDSNLDGANLEKAMLYYVTMERTRLCKANLRNIRMYIEKKHKYQRFYNDPFINFKNCNLCEVDFRWTNLENVGFENVNLTNAKLEGTKLTGVNLKETILVGARLNKVNLRNRNFKKMNLSKSVFNNSDLTSADFEEADLTKADISGANIYHIKTPGWKIEDIQCTHIYYCPDKESWENPKKREKYCCKLAPDKFKEFMKFLPTVEQRFDDALSVVNYIKLSEGITGTPPQQQPGMDGTVIKPEPESKETVKEKFEYKVWYKDSEPIGEPITTKTKKEIVANKKNYLLLIIKDETITQAFINGNKCNPPTITPYRILSYILKHQGTGGTAWNIAKYIYNIQEAEKFRDLREFAKVVKLQPNLNKAEKQELEGNTSDEVEKFSNRIRKMISSDLNSDLLKDSGIKLRADKNNMKEYELIPLPEYCLIEKT